ncbi:permease-like cell division protein FtsX [Desulfitobacterium hafniense]|uniref:permease-like cell division protein FtsX n=1 Tax=Desulfitobacterium hafniense TaxID=49338 RepID=UPI0003A24329|nr:permease-like cell division protein FtsX [Desulfitobacterium hafniense]
MALNSVEYIFREVFNSIRRNVWLSIASVLTVMISMVILGASVFFLLNASNLAANFESELEIAVFAEDDLDAAAVAALGEKLKGLAGVDTIELVPKDQALKDFTGSVNSATIAADLGDTNPFPDKYTVHVVDPQQVENVAAQITKLTGVDNVVYGKNLVEPLLKFTKWLRWAGTAVVGLFAIASLILISLNIKMNVFSRRKEIEIMKLVGASNAFIRWPFILEGMFLGWVGGLLAILLVGFGYDWLANYIQTTLAFMPVVNETELIGKVLGSIVLLGMGIGAAGSVISLRRFLKV